VWHETADLPVEQGLAEKFCMVATAYGLSAGIWLSSLELYSMFLISNY